MRMKVLYITAEAAPYVKVGGLGDVAGTLPLALQKIGVDIRIALPFHHQIDRSHYSLKNVCEFDVPAAFGPVATTVYETKLGTLVVYLIDSPLMPESGPVYAMDSALDGPKFVHFSLAVLELARRLDWKPNVLHAQDWHTAAAVYALHLQRDVEKSLSKMAALLTIHNLPYHGEGASKALEDFGLPPATRSPLPWWAQNRPLALGLLAADHINAVSPGYAAEMLTEEFGAGLDEFLKNHKPDSISGILNGIDLDEWDPSSDTALVANYSRSNLGPKKDNRAALQQELGLPEDLQGPIFGIVSRMDEQKGIDFALNALRMIADEPWQAVILGNGSPQIEEAARQLAKDFPQRVHTRIDFDSALGRRIYAGVDAFLIPSRYEPCGLTQMIAMRYGTVPIARAVGGLKDTIMDYDSSSGGTGFLFKDPTPVSLAATIRRALVVFSDQRRWRGLQLRGMKEDFSWESSADQYAALYKRLVKDRIE